MTKNKLLGLVGVIVLGALGSGLWELIKPLLGWAWSATLTVATLGMSSLRDGMYADAANSIGRPLGLSASVQMLASLIALTGSVVLRGACESIPPMLRRGPQLLVIMLTTFSLATLIGAVRSGYVSNVAVFNLKLETMAAPYLSDVQFKQLRANYVTIDTRANYLAHIEALRTVIQTAGRVAPTRDFF